MPDARVVRGDVALLRLHLHRLRERHALPSGVGLARECCGREGGAARRPERPGVGAGVALALVEPETGDVAVKAGVNFTPTSTEPQSFADAPEELFVDAFGASVAEKSE